MRIATTLLLLGACAPSSLKDASASVFLVNGNATAFVVRVDSKGVLLATAKHILKPTVTSYRVEGLGTARHYWSDPKRDLAFLLVEKPTRRPRPIALGPAPKLGDRLRVVGFGGIKYGKWISEGIYSGGTRVSASVWYGSSGGAVLDAEGRVVGVVVQIGWYPRMHFTPHPIANPTQSIFVRLSELPQ